jgi:outer membrane protein
MAFRRLMMIAAAAAALAGFAATASAQAPLKVGVVSLQRSLEATAEIKQAELDLKTKFGPRQEEIGNMQRDLAKMEQDAQSNQGKYNEAALAELQQRMQRRQTQIQRLGQQLQEDVSSERQEVLNRVGKNLTEIVKKVAEEKGLDLVVDSTAALYFKPVFDISADVTAAYDKAYPAKK